MNKITLDEAEDIINADCSYLNQHGFLWGLYDNDQINDPIVDYQFFSKEELIRWYFKDMGWDEDYIIIQ